MICMTGLILLLFAVTVDGRVGDSTSESSYCTETKECFLFDLVCAGDGYEVRHYEAAKWVTTEAESYFMEIATSRAFRKLYKYITGENEAVFLLASNLFGSSAVIYRTERLQRHLGCPGGAKIDMTAPVLINVSNNTSMWQPSVYGLSFLLPSKYQANPPKPTDASVYLTDTPDMKVYVKSYGGWMISLVAKSQVETLKTSLDNVKATYETEYHYNVGYNSPMKIMNRHNEAWFIVKGEPVCPRNE